MHIHREGMGRGSVSGSGSGSGSGSVSGSVSVSVRAVDVILVIPLTLTADASGLRSFNLPGHTRRSRSRLGGLLLLRVRPPLGRQRPVAGRFGCSRHLWREIRESRIG